MRATDAGIAPIGAGALAWQLFLAGLRARHRQTLLGYAWLIVPPVATSLLWIYLQSRQVVRIQTGTIPYAIFVLSGTLLWQTFADAVQAPIAAVTESRAVLCKINFPRGALLLSGVLNSVTALLVRLAVIVPLLAWLGHEFDFTSLRFIPGVCVLLGAGTVVGILLVPLAVLYSDVQKGLPLALQFWMYLTPVIYPLSVQGAFAWINPVGPVLEATRHALLGGSAANTLSMTAAAGTVALMLVAAWLLFRVSMPHLIERMGA